MLNLQHRKFLFSYAILPLLISQPGVSTNNSVININSPSPQIIAQQGFKNWIDSIFKRRQRQRLGTRGNFCLIAPGLLDTYVIWHDRPLFIWQGTGAQTIRVRDRQTQTILWTQSFNPNTQQITYNGQEPLQPGQLYQWQLLGSQPSRIERDRWITFQVMSTDERNRIKVDLQALEQKLQATGTAPEDIALKKADYFIDYKIEQKSGKSEAIYAWSDALQILYEVENPSSLFAKQRQSLVTDLCVGSSTTTILDKTLLTQLMVRGKKNNY